MRLFLLLCFCYANFSYAGVTSYRLGAYRVEIDQDLSFVSIYDSLGEVLASSVEGSSLVEVERAIDRVKITVHLLVLMKKLKKAVKPLRSLRL